MARKRTELGPNVDALIGRKLPLDELHRQAKAAGVDVSRRTLARRAAEAKEPKGSRLGLRDRINAKRTAAGKPELPPKPPPGEDAGIPDEPTGDETLADIEAAIEQCDAALDAADEDGNLSAFGVIMARKQGWIDRRQKYTPPAQQDPATSPDYVAAGERAATRLHTMIDALFAPPPGST